MKIMDSVDKLMMLCKILRRGDAGSLRDISKMMHVSRSSVGVYMKELKDLGADIRYDRKLNTHYFNAPFDIRIEIKKN